MSAPAGLSLASRAGRLVVLATVLASGMAQLDSTMVGVALPRIGRDLHVGLTSLQWTVNAYTLTLSGLLLLGGSLGDRMGRRRIFQFGVIWFTVASIGCALAPNGAVLIAVRALQGVGAALLMPGSLAILEAVFRREDRAAAVGAWSGLGGVAGAAGPIIGGALVGAGPWGWRLAFLINVPLGVAVLITSRSIPETRDEQASGRLDLSGAALAALGLSGVVYGLTEGPSNGWGPVAIVSALLGLAMLIGFLVNEARVRDPMMPLGLFRNRTFTASNVTTFILYGALAGALFLVPVELQNVSGYTPFEAGLSLLPVTALLFLLSARVGRMSSKYGPRWFMTAGPIIAGVGLVLLSRVGEHTSYLSDVLPAILVFGLGMALTVAPLTATVLAAAPEHQVGVASAVNNDTARTAGLIAVAVLPGLAGITSAAYAHPAALSAGFGRAVIIAGIAAAAAGLVSALLVSNDVMSKDAG
jgi:EmrB/QacA subfamily drug resistance transporter